MDCRKLWGNASEFSHLYCRFHKKAKDAFCFGVDKIILSYFQSVAPSDFIPNCTVSTRTSRVWGDFFTRKIIFFLAYPPLFPHVLYKNVCILKSPEAEKSPAPTPTQGSKGVFAIHCFFRVLQNKNCTLGCPPEAAYEQRVLSRDWIHHGSSSLSRLSSHMGFGGLGGGVEKLP